MFEQLVIPSWNLSNGVRQTFQISSSVNPSEAIISIGATRYTEYGEKTFLLSGGESIVIVYDNTKLSSEDILKAVKSSQYDNSTMSVLAQKVL